MRYSSHQSYNLTPLWAIMIVCFLVFIATLVSQELVLLLGLTPKYFWHMPWTIVTNLFVHGGLWHLLANMLTLYFFGRFLIRLTGTQNFLIIYFLGGILGNILFMLLGPSLSTVIGASGAIFALGGTLTVLTPKLRVFIFPIPVPLPLWVAIIGGFLIMSPLFFPQVAWEGHLGGLLLGLIAGFILRKKGRRFIY